eukprot:EG_transcript_6046
MRPLWLLGLLAALLWLAAPSAADHRVGAAEASLVTRRDRSAHQENSEAPSRSHAKKGGAGRGQRKEATPKGAAPGALGPAKAEEGEGEGKAEEAEEKAINIAIATMLFGSIAFQMSLFYLVNHPDEDMKKYSWETISSTISIFCSVLTFEGFRGILEWVFLDSQGAFWKIIGSFAHFLFWLLLMQAMLYWLSGAHLPGTGHAQPSHQFHCRAKAAALLLAHITGFASINAWAQVQQLPFFAASPWRAFSVVFVAFGALIGLSQATDTWREWKALEGDATKTAHEALWDEEVEEAEDDVVGLTVSFLTIQAIRFAITNELPSLSGELHTKPTHYASFLLLLWSFASVLCVVFLGPTRNRLAESQKGTTKERFVSGLHVIASMCFAWSLLHVIRDEVANLSVAQLGEGVLASVIIALIVSGTAFLLIFGLDKLADLDMTDADADDAIKTVILSFGIMVGFSWEKCFDSGMETISEELLAQGNAQHWGKFLMAAVLVAIVLPAWRAYILPRKLAEHVHSHAEGAANPASSHGHSHGPGHGHSHGGHDNGRETTPLLELPRA